MLGPVSTDALNRAPGTGYGEITGVTQTVRNFGASLGMAVLGSIFVSRNVPSARPSDIAHSTQTVVYVMAAIMATAFVLAKFGLKRGHADEVETEDRKVQVAAG